MNKPKIIIWDQGGVLFRGMFKGKDNKYPKFLLNKYGISKSKFIEAFQLKKDKYLKGKSIVEIEKLFLDKLEINISPEESMQERMEVEGILSVDQRLIKIMWKLEEAGYKQTYLTNGVAHYLKYLEFMNKTPRFLPGIESDLVMLYKPDPKIFEMLEETVKEYYLSTSELLFIDDQQRNIDIANERGWSTYHYQNYDDFIKYVNTYLI